MDTYWRTNDNCVKCGRCVKACKEKSRWKCLIGGRDVRPDIWLDNIPCHTCSRDFNGNPPCEDACYYDAIRITRS